MFVILKMIYHDKTGAFLLSPTMVARPLQKSLSVDFRILFFKNYVSKKSLISLFTIIGCSQNLREEIKVCKKVKKP